MSGGVAAFFDLDGTLMPLPSLERPMPDIQMPPC